MLAHWTQRNTTYSGLQQYGIGQTDRETGPENERHRERAIERVRPIVTFALGKASGLRRGVQISPMLPILSSMSVSLTPLTSPHSLSPAIAPSLPPERPSPSCRPSAYVGLRHAIGFRGTIRLPPLSLPLASREASPLTGLWQPSGIDQERSLGTTCGIRIDNYMYRFILNSSGSGGGCGRGWGNGSGSGIGDLRIS